jgi:hypothetical protein
MEEGCIAVCGPVQGWVEPVCFCRLADPFIAQNRIITLGPGARQVAPEWLNHNIAGHYRLEVANCVFKGMEHVMSCRPITLCTIHGMASSCRVIWHCSSAPRVVNRADVVLQPHCSHMSAHLAIINGVSCPHVLQAHVGSTSGALETCVCIGNTRG